MIKKKKNKQNSPESGQRGKTPQNNKGRIR